MSLTTEQTNALWKDGKPLRDLRIISARPGTGKTTTLTQYCIDLAEDWKGHHKTWQGLAAISYTNVAREELERKVKEQGRANTLLSAPHFVGTIDSFINQYIFLPFGSRHLECPNRPRMVGEPFSPWRPSAMQYAQKPDDAYPLAFFDAYSVDKNDNPIRTDTIPRQLTRTQTRAAWEVTNLNTNKIMSLKRYIWQQGFALQNDANYFAYKILRDDPELTAYLINRFPVLIIDEAQDMTELQHALLDHLQAAGQKHIVIIGDEYQAIYEWNTAKPQLFVEKTASADWVNKSFTHTFRCSEAICVCLNLLANDDVLLAPAEDNKNAQYSSPISIKGYSADEAQQKLDIKSAIDDMAMDLSEKIPHNYSENGILRLAVLTRSREDVDKLQAIFTNVHTNTSRPVVWNNKSTREYAKVIYYLTKSNTYHAFKAYENLLLRMSNFEEKGELRRSLANDWSDGNNTATIYRNTIFSDLSKIKNLIPEIANIQISDCSRVCPRGLAAISDTNLAAFEADFSSFNSGDKRQQNRPLGGVMTAHDERIFFKHSVYENVEIVFSTIHGVKGETYDGVLFYVKARTSGCTCNPAKALWRDILTHPLITCENKRLVYVAVSRAAQDLHILCPEDQESIWESVTRIES